MRPDEASESADLVSIDVEHPTDRTQLINVVAWDGVDVIRLEVGEKIRTRGVEARERMRPAVGGLAHQGLVRRSIVLLERAPEDMHPVSVNATGEPGKRQLAWRCEMMDRCSAGWKIEVCWVQMDVTEVSGWVVGPVGKPSRVLARVAEVPYVAVGMVVAHIGEEDRRSRELMEYLHRQGAIPMSASVAQM